MINLIQSIILPLKNVLHGFEKNFEKATELYEKLVEINDSSAMNNIAWIYLRESTGIEKTPQKTIELFQKAAKLKNPNSMYILATFYQNGTNGFKKNVEKAI